MKKNPTLYIVRAAVVAALYVGLTYAFYFLSFETVQFRVSEALTILPLIFPEAIAGLFVGCILSNIASPFGAFDMIFGSAATLLAASLSFIIGFYVRKHAARAILGAFPPILANAFIIPAVIILFGVPEAYWALFGWIFLGQFTVVFALGMPLYFALLKTHRRAPVLFGRNMFDYINSKKPASTPEEEPMTQLNNETTEQ